MLVFTKYFRKVQNKNIKYIYKAKAKYLDYFNNTC